MFLYSPMSPYFELPSAARQFFLRYPKGRSLGPSFPTLLGIQCGVGGWISAYAGVIVSGTGTGGTTGTSGELSE